MSCSVFSLKDDPSVLPSDPQPFGRITALKPSAHDQNRVNVFISDRFFCSLTIAQVVDQKLKIGLKLDSAALDTLKEASAFGKLYARALEYVFLRPHSKKEIRDYLVRKTHDRLVRVKDRQSGEYRTVSKKGFAFSLVQPVLDRLEARGYLDDRQFAKIWIENRQQTKGISLKKLRLELIKKGVNPAIIEEALQQSDRNDLSELRKILTKKRQKYPDEARLIQFLLRQGFSYSDIVASLSEGAPSSFGA